MIWFLKKSFKKIVKCAVLSFTSYCACVNSVSGRAAGTRWTVETTMFKHVFLTGPPGNSQQ